jgi:hypothetical protein
VGSEDGRRITDLDRACWKTFAADERGWNTEIFCLQIPLPIAFRAALCVG